MRVFIFLILFSTAAYGQDIRIITRPEAIYVQRVTGNITPMERIFFHIIVHNASQNPVTIELLRFHLSSAEGAVLSGQYSGPSLTRLFDSAIDRRRIEPTPKQTLTIGPDQRKAVSDVFIDCPADFAGDSLTVEVQYQSGGVMKSERTTSPLNRVEGFSGRLPFEGTWYVASEHSYQDPHKRFAAEAFAYDFIQIGANGKSYQREGLRNSDYYAYGKKVLATKDGKVVFVQTAIAENEPGKTNVNMPGGNVVVIDHGDNQFSYYAHLRPNTIMVREGAQVRAGDVLGEVGNSGDSLEPQLHFHVMNHASPDQADGIPAVFTMWKAQAYGRSPVVRDLAPLPRGEFVAP